MATKTKPIKVTVTARGMQALQRLGDGVIPKDDVGGGSAPYHHATLKRLVKDGLARETKKGFSILAKGRKALKALT